MVRKREERKSRDMVMMGEGMEGDGFFLRYTGKETGDARVGG